MSKKCRFIAFEGGEGCGKTTQSRILQEYLERKGVPTLLTIEPGGTPAGETIRSILLNPATKTVPLTDVFLFCADRCQHYHEVIKPALSEGKVVITDRFWWSTAAYQSFGGKVPLDLISNLSRSAVNGAEPDLWVLFDIDPVEAMRRKAGEQFDRFEQKQVDFHKRVRKGFLKLAEAASNVVILDAGAPIEVVTSKLLSAVCHKIGVPYQPALDF